MLSMSLKGNNKSKKLCYFMCLSNMSRGKCVTAKWSVILTSKKGFCYSVAAVVKSEACALFGVG